MKRSLVVSLIVGTTLSAVAQDYPADLHKYESALQSAHERNDTETEATMMFHVGRLYQKQAENGCAPDECSRLTEQAIDAYERALKLSPMSAGTINNLALLYAANGNNGQASKWFERLIGIDTPNSGLYALNYARFLSKNVGVSDAKTYFEYAMRDPAVSAEATRAYGNVLAESGDHKTFLMFAWRNFREYPPLVEELALNVIAANQWSEDEQLELLDIVVAALVNQDYAPGEFFNSRLASKLSDLVSHPTLGRGVGEILAIHRVPVPEVSQLTWWANVRTIRSDDQTLAPHQAFRSLTLHLGDQHAKRGERELATKLYYVAAFLNLDRPDPVAFFKLVSSYYAQDIAPDQFYKAVDEYEPRLYSLKSAFSPEDWCTMFDFHRQIGILHGLLAGRAKRNESGAAWIRAVNELEKARSLLSSCTKIADGDLEPYSIDLLSQGYSSTDRAVLANRVRLDAAETYLKRNKPDYAASVLERVNVPTLESHDQMRFQQIIAALAPQH